MKFKLDENLGEREANLLRVAGHDTTTVHSEGLCSRPDEAVFEAAVQEERALISLDHDFGNVLRFPPASSHGIVVLELPPHPTPESIRQRLTELLAFMGAETLRNDLWIVEPGRVRVHEREDIDF